MRKLLLCLLTVAGLATEIAGAQQPGKGAGQFRISGTVVSALNGQPLAATTVRIAPVANQDAVQVFATSADGKFLFEHLAPGKYTLTAARHGFREQAFEGHGFFSTAIVLGPNLESEGLIFRLNPNSQISGIVTDEGEPVTNGQAMLLQRATQQGIETTRFIESTQIDSDGNYHFGQLVPGTYFVAVHAEPWYAQHSFTSVPQPTEGLRTFVTHGGQSQTDPKLDVVYPITFYGNSQDASGATAIAIRSGEKYQADISLQAIRAVRLRLHTKSDPEHMPNVYAKESTPGPQGQIVYGMSQRMGDVIELIGLPPGHLVLNVQSQGLARREEIDLSGDTDMDLADKPQAEPLTGIIAVQDGPSLPPNLWVTLHEQHSGKDFGGGVEADGTFSIRTQIPAGKYNIYVANSGSYVVDRIAASGARVLGQAVEIKSGQAVRLAITLSHASAHLDGTAIWDDKPTAGMMIVLVPEDPNNNPALFRMDQSDSDGTFTLRAIVPGKYTLIALRDAWEKDWADPTVLAKYVVGGQKVEIAANGSYTAKVKAQSF